MKMRLAALLGAPRKETNDCWSSRHLEAVTHARDSKLRAVGTALLLQRHLILLDSFRATREALPDVNCPVNGSVRQLLLPLKWYRDNQNRKYSEHLT